jgi:Tfp pilus assembly protein PilX
MLSEEASAMREAEATLRSASATFAVAGRRSAAEAFDKGVEDGIKNAGIDAAIGLGDDAVTTVQEQTQDGHESQQQIDDDLSWR